MRARIDITEVETRTKIRAKYLRALENEEWDLLPGEIYVKSFLRTYGDYLGLDTRQLIDDFKRRYERPTDHELRPITPRSRERDRRPRGPRVPAWLLIAGVLAMVFIALVIVGNNANNPTKGSKSTQSTSAHVTTRPAHRGRAHHRTTIPVARTPRTPRIPRTVRLKLTPTGQVWVCLVDGTGRKLISGVTYDVGQSIPTETSSKLLLTLGNDAVTIKVNGKAVTLPASASAIGVELTPRGETTLPASQQPTCT